MLYPNLWRLLKAIAMVIQEILTSTAAQSFKVALLFTLVFTGGPPVAPRYRFTIRAASGPIQHQLLMTGQQFDGPRGTTLNEHLSTLHRYQIVFTLKC